jgi:phosphatidate cytidylyltransferase
MAQPLIQSNLGNLSLRIISAAVILPVVFAALWYGDWVFAILLGSFGGVMCWEWLALCGARASPEQWMAVGVAAAAPLLTQAGFGAVVFALIGGGGLLVYLTGMFRHAPNPFLASLGLPYVGLTMAAAVWLRADPGTGFMTLVWIICLVVATDVGAYFTGRSVGGPKLMPRVSPNKTWSGLIGGALCAGLTGLLIGNAATGAISPALGALSVGLACVAQGGDLIESGLKRHFNVKDASQLIPGHGGFLDRFDGYLTVMPVTALMALASGESPLVWQ